MDWSEIVSTLGYYNYRNILADEIINSIETVFFTGNCGTRFYETRTCLKNKGTMSPQYDFYGKIDGTGTSRIKLVSQLKSISESLERLAFYNYHHTEQYGFDHEKTTTGMAAMPKIFSEQTPTLAMYEAIERWAIIEWWNGKLSASALKSKEEISYFEIKVPVPDCKVILAFMKKDDKYSYGFASSNTTKKALQKAEVELERNAFVLNRIKNEEAKHVDERRLIYFAGESGFSLFQEVYNRSITMNDRTTIPRCLFNGKIDGQWSKYACVWRTLFEYSSYDFLNPKINFFIF